MCNPTLAISALSAGMQYQQSITQQKIAQQQAIRQNEVAAKNLAYKQKTSALKLKQSTEQNLKKLEIAEKEVRRKKATYITNKTFTGNTYDSLMASYYRSEGDYRNTVLGNIEKNKSAFTDAQEAYSTQYDSQTSYIMTPDYLYTAGASALSFAGDYYDYRAQQKSVNAKNKYYDYDYGADD